MKKMMFIICLLIGSQGSFLQATQPIKNKNHEYVLWDAARATFLFVAGSWLANEQLPRLAGKKIEFDAPVFTKVGASILFAIGITGGLVGAYTLTCMLREKLSAPQEKSLNLEHNSDQEEIINSDI